MINQPFPQCPSEEWITFIKETNPKILIHRIYLGEVHFKILITLGKREALKPKEPHVKSLTELSKYKNLPGVQARCTFFFLWRLRKMAKYHTKNKAPRFFSFFRGVEVKMRRWLPQAFFAIGVRRLFCYFSRWENSFEVGGKSFNFFGGGISLTIRGKKPSRAAVQKTTPSKEFFIEISLRSCYAFWLKIPLFFWSYFDLLHRLVSRLCLNSRIRIQDLGLPNPKIRYPNLKLRRMVQFEVLNSGFGIR